MIMLTLANVRDWLKPQIIDVESTTIGKLDTSKNKAVCIYNRESTDNRIAIGGIENTPIANKKISILVHWGTNCNTAELKAQEIYNLFQGTQTINGNKCFFNIEFDEPVSLGTDDKGIYEFTIELTIIYER